MNGHVTWSRGRVVEVAIASGLSIGDEEPSHVSATTGTDDGARSSDKSRSTKTSRSTHVLCVRSHVLAITDRPEAWTATRMGEWRMRHNLR